MGVQDIEQSWALTTEQTPHKRLRGSSGVTASMRERIGSMEWEPPPSLGLYFTSPLHLAPPHQPGGRQGLRLLNLGARRQGQAEQLLDCPAGPDGVSGAIWKERRHGLL